MVVALSPLISLPHGSDKIGKARENMDNKGFTVLELIFCIAILGILMAIGIPTYMDYLPRYRADGAIRRLFTELQYAKMKAIAENEDYFVVFDTASNSYSILKDKDSDGWQGLGSEDLIRTVNLDEGFPGITFGYAAINNWADPPTAITKSIYFTGSPPRAMFYPTGLAKNGSVYLKPTEDTARNDRLRAISIALTGRIRIRKYNGSSWE